MEKIFTKIYRNNSWGGISRSGRGSDLFQTKTIRVVLSELFKSLNIKTILDIPCGDFFWFQELKYDFESYIGADIVEDIILENNRRFQTNNRKFVKLDITKDPLPKVDLIFCRDLFIHFSIPNVFFGIENIKRSKSTYLLSTSHTGTFRNKSIKTGEFHDINLLRPPYFFPEPIKIIDEKNPEEFDVGRSLLLWKISDL